MGRVNVVVVVVCMVAIWSSWPPTNASRRPPRKYITNITPHEEEEILDTAAILRLYSTRFNLSTAHL